MKGGGTFVLVLIVTLLLKCIDRKFLSQEWLNVFIIGAQTKSMWTDTFIEHPRK